MEPNNSITSHTQVFDIVTRLGALAELEELAAELRQTNPSLADRVEACGIETARRCHVVGLGVGFLFSAATAGDPDGISRLFGQATPTT